MALSCNNQITETSVLLKGLRQELKEWETSFFAAHNRKAAREDIKQLPDIEKKYKEYNDLRYPPARPVATRVSTPSRKRHRSHVPPASATPNKRPKPAHALHPSTIDPYDPPLSSVLSPIAHRTSIGPTPQKDGMVLGLFDNLTPHPHSRTPSKRNALLAVTGNLHATPSKRPSSQGCDEVDLASAGKRPGRFPLGASKQSHLNTYLTPSAYRNLESSTPSSRCGVSKLCFDDTPAFLRRDSQRVIPGKENEGLDEDILWSPVTVRRQSKAYAGRGLSVLVKGLRDMEDERLDEEWDMLREMEDKGGSKTKREEPKILVNDSQRPEMPLGPDGVVESEEDIGAHEGKGLAGKSLRVWKKKGQKRTTRKVVIRPDAVRWKPEPAWNGGNEREDDGEGVLVEETQRTKRKPNNDDLEYDNDGTVHEDETEFAAEQKTASRDKNEGKDGFVRKVKKKISATAHANFRALKIKNKQSKGKRGGRFGRKR